MAQIVATVKSQYGIHARPSGAIYLVATKKFPNTKIIIKDLINNKQAKANSILELMMMALPCGAVVTVYTSGVDEDQAAKAIAEVIETYEVEEK